MIYFIIPSNLNHFSSYKDYSPKFNASTAPKTQQYTAFKIRQFLTIIFLTINQHTQSYLDQFTKFNSKITLTNNQLFGSCVKLVGYNLVIYLHHFGNLSW